MPPSGFSEPAIAGLRTFFETTLDDLKKEVAEGKYPSLQDGLAHEVRQISMARHNTLLQQCEKEILLSTLHFYEQVAIHGEDFALQQVSAIISLHITETGEVVRR